MSRLDFQCRYRYATGFELELQFQAGEGVTALFGPSGSGKSTILALIAGLLRPQAGFIRLDGRVLVDTSRGQWLPAHRRGIGCVFQDHLLFPHLSVEKNLRYGMRRRPARPVNFQRVVDILELHDLLDRQPHTLSGGQQQRVALGRAILRGPELLLLDEPFSALDDSLKGRILVYLERTLSEFPIPTLLVSHQQADIRRLAKRVVILNEGKVQASGPAAATLEGAAGTH